jgi:hypothetical protein
MNRRNPRPNPLVVTLEQKRKLSRLSQARIDAWTDTVKRDRHDGVALSFGDATVELVAFDPAQVKSAIGNRGTFDPNDPNILHQSQDGAIALGGIARPHGRARIETSCRAKTCSRPWRKTPNRPCSFSNCRSTGWSSQVGRSRFSPNPLGGST